MRVTRREYTELLLHLMQSPFWMQSEENQALFFRSAEDGTPSYGLFAQLAEETVELKILADGDQEPFENHLFAMLWHWTSAGHRMVAEKFLRQDLSIADDTAAVVALAMSLLKPEPEDVPDIVDAIPPLTETAERERTFPIHGGGYVRLEQTGDLTLATISLPDAGESGFFPLAFSGFVRAFGGGTTRDRTATVIGGDITWKPQETGPIEIPVPVVRDVLPISESGSQTIVSAAERLEEKPVSVFVCGKRWCEQEGQEHDWTGPVVPTTTDGFSGESITCARCGIDRMTVDLMTLP